MSFKAQRSYRRFRASVLTLLMLFSFVFSGSAADLRPQRPERQKVKIVPGQLPAPGQIQHVVFIMKENRSFDHYFGLFPGAYGTNTGVTSSGQTIPLWRAPDVMLHEGGHDYMSGLTDIDGGAMDRFDLGNFGNKHGDYQAYTQMTQADIPNYWAYAQNFVLADQTFASDLSPSYNPHLYSIAATGEGTVNTPFLGKLTLGNWGCDAKAGALITLLDAQGAFSDTYPCFDPLTIADSLNNANPPLTWTFYTPQHPQGGYEHSAFDYVQHIRRSSYWATNVVDFQRFATDALNGNLPAVSWIIADTPETEHPPNSTCVGENWTVNQINAIMQGPADQWNSTVIFVTWDEWGGFYDHSAPPVVDQWGFGIRVPMLIISPYAIQGYVSHTTYEFSSVLKFIEENFGLPFLTDRDTNANDTTDSFNFSQAPLSPLYLQPRSCPVAATTVLPYGDVPVKHARDLYVTLNNYGSTPITFGNIAAAGNFKYETGGTCGSALANGTSCTLKVAFQPKSAGPLTGTLTINDSDPSSPQVVNLNGLGTYLSLPTNYPGLVFPLTYLGSSSQQQFLLSNSGSSSITINQVQMIGDFSESDNCNGSVAPGSNCQVTVTFAPTSSGDRMGNIVIWNSDPASPHQVRLSGDATAVQQTPTTMSFSSTVGQASAPQTITVTNTSAASLFVETVTVATPFSQTNNCPTQLPAGQQCTITVTFTPTQQGSVNTTLYVNNSDLMSPHEVQLAGTGN
ncbi:MAG TPA: alkaline phosphatase family protein [Terriglobales bacterium]